MRLLRIYNNNDKIILKIWGCDDCPLMRYEHSTKKSYCREFNNLGNNLLIEDTPIYYNVDASYFSFEMIDIPTWCKLPYNYGELINNKQIYEITDDRIIIRPFTTKEYILPQTFIRKECNILTGKSKNIFPEDYNKNKITFIDETINNSNDIKSISEIRSLIVSNNEISDPVVVKKLNKCSRCNKEYKYIDKNINFGLCKRCWKFVKKDKNLSNKYFINNFRLKRNVEPFNGELKISFNLDLHSHE